ncbi:YobA family protein [Caldibacillus thermolactis]|jgi:putative cell wall-binding protein|uniref:YobA family protein n=1 Tax=Pallidibacillus thermolactis TaxID=251051 RepID=A0ABT2WI22_9BACI|nr:YobA family protein [Pallidibacillus thermolactis]MCU9595344.1 YobA family protein [Pallidibacillus thermolactis]MED1675072.1 YobA family protein [Pallidibacillus thermolactis subsp. kokeshiiformis]
MKRIFKVLIIMLILLIIGCSHSVSPSENKERSSFTGTIKEIDGNRAVVSAVLVEGNPEGDVIVDLSLNKNDTFQVGDKIKVEFDGVIRESNPAQINTLSVELVD